MPNENIENQDQEGFSPEGDVYTYFPTKQAKEVPLWRKVGAAAVGVLGAFVAGAAIIVVCALIGSVIPGAGTLAGGFLGGLYGVPSAIMAGVKAAQRGYATGHFLDAFTWGFTRGIGGAIARAVGGRNSPFINPFNGLENHGYEKRQNSDLQQQQPKLLQPDITITRESSPPHLSDQKLRSDEMELDRMEERAKQQRVAQQPQQQREAQKGPPVPPPRPRRPTGGWGNPR